MSNALDLLAAGAWGLVWTPPTAVEILKQGPEQVLARTTDGVLWMASLDPFPFALMDDQALRADLEASARAVFERHWQSAKHDGGEPRTADAAWSPLIEVEVLAAKGGPILRVVRRVSYAPGDEVVIGQLVAPVADGHVDLWILAKAGVTGMRETMIVSKMRSAVDQDDEIVLPKQSVFDDPALDATFPDHPLSQVRAALAAVVPTIEVREPAAPHDALMTLEGPGCELALPPRYQPMARIGNLSSSLAILARTGLEAWRRTLDVWRVPGLSLRKRTDPQATLAIHAKRCVGEWTEQGAAAIEATVRPIAPFGERPQVELHVHFETDGQPTQSYQRWWIEPDGVVFRVCSGGPPSVPRTELETDVDIVQARWRRLDAPSARPWWKIW